MKQDANSQRITAPLLDGLSEPSPMSGTARRSPSQASPQHASARPTPRSEPSPGGKPACGAQALTSAPRELAWPRLAHLGISRNRSAARASYIGGSDANTILSGSDERIVRLWREKRGELAAEDLSHKLPVMLGCWTEAFNRQWYELMTGHGVIRVGEWLQCEVHPWRACTLDGYIASIDAVWEAKHTSSFARGEDLV